MGIKVNNMEKRWKHNITGQSESDGKLHGTQEQDQYLINLKKFPRLLLKKAGKKINDQIKKVEERKGK